jgi:hypothetical protein
MEQAASNSLIRPLSEYNSALVLHVTAVQLPNSSGEVSMITGIIN